MPTAPASIGGVVDNAIRLYRGSFVAVFPIVLLTVLLMLVPSILLASHMQQLALDPQNGLGQFLTGPVVLGYLAMIVVACVMYGAMFAQIDAVAHGGRLTLGDSLGAGMKSALVMLGVGVLFTVMFMAGLVLLVIPGIYVWGVFQLAFVTPITERAGVMESLGTSRKLVKGNWWRTSVIVFVTFVIMYVLILVVGFIAGLIAAATGSLQAAVSDPAGTALFQNLLSSVLNLFTMSLLPCVLLAVYYDLKLRLEGGDLAQRVEALNAAG